MEGQQRVDEANEWELRDEAIRGCAKFLFDFSCDTGTCGTGHSRSRDAVGVGCTGVGRRFDRFVARGVVR